MSLFGSALNLLPAVGFMTNALAARQQAQQAQPPAPADPEDDDGEQRREQGANARESQIRHSRNRGGVWSDVFHHSLLAQEEHGRRHGEMIQNVNGAWKSEMDRRAEQAAEERKWQHLENIEAMRSRAEPSLGELSPYGQPMRPRRSLGSTFAIDGNGERFINGTPLRSALLS